MEGQKKSALRKAFREALVPNSLIEDLLELLVMDDSGQIYIGDYGIEQLRKLLDELEIAEGVEMSPLAVIRASLDAQGASAYSPEAGTMDPLFRASEPLQRPSLRPSAGGEGLLIRESGPFRAGVSNRGPARPLRRGGEDEGHDAEACA